jgi:exodeoxyribonuclease V
LAVARQHEKARIEIERWFAASESQVFRLFGYAGTGKTTLAREIPERLGIDPRDVLFGAYTGKAAHVLRGKGCADAQTLHSLIYTPVERSRAELVALKKQLADQDDPVQRRRLASVIQKLEVDLQSPNFVVNRDSDLNDARLLVVDEVSMVNKRIAEDLMSFKKPLLVMGDPAQLPPVQGKGFFMQDEPEVLLTKIHRQAEGSEVLKLATRVRSGKGLHRSVLRRPTREEAMEFDQVIVGTNAERWRRIHVLRELHGLKKTLPQRGDEVIVTQNNRDLDVFNGQMFTVVERLHKAADYVRLRVRDDEGEKREITAWSDGFRGLAGEGRIKALGYRTTEHAVMTYGWAITCHKSQGSQWGTVLVVDDWRYNDRSRWLYTAITRASDRIAIYDPRNR